VSGSCKYLGPRVFTNRVDCPLASVGSVRDWEAIGVEVCLVILIVALETHRPRLVPELVPVAIGGFELQRVSYDSVLVQVRAEVLVACSIRRG